MTDPKNPNLTNLNEVLPDNTNETLNTTNLNEETPNDDDQLS